MSPAIRDMADGKLRAVPCGHLRLGRVNEKDCVHDAWKGA